MYEQKEFDQNIAQNLDHYESKELEPNKIRQ